MKVFVASNVNPVERMHDAELAWLIPQCIAGSEDAIARLVHHYETGVFRLALSIVGDVAEANEITQDVFIAVLRSLPSYQEKKSFKAWLYTITLNHSRSHLRRRKALERLKATLTAIFRIDGQKHTLPEDTLIQNEKEALLWNCLNGLDERLRVVIILRYFHEMSTSEIAEVLSIPEGTVHSRLHNARERLRSALEHLDGI